LLTGTIYREMCEVYGKQLISDKQSRYSVLCLRIAILMSINRDVFREGLRR
jgi:hypothetical protein